ncbi:MAG: TnsA endonuclease N-terminal domain-containing protein [Planctomycetota bacterium]|nr:TnsA endonuclease N-terminal domain-containing protein [Planctomycetota bacterium]
MIRQALLRADKWALGRTVFSSKRQLLIVYPADEVLLVQTLFDPAQRRAAMPVDQDAVQIDRKEVDAITRWIESMDEPIRWQELRDDTDDAGCSYIVPDFLVEMTNGHKRLVEVKPSDRLAKPLAQRKLSVARQYAATEGWAFHLVTLRRRRCRPKPRVSAAAKPRSATVGNEWPKSLDTPTGFHTRNVTGRANCETPLGFARW